MGYFFFVRPVLRVREARNWVETRCRIVSSDVGEHPGSKGTTYSVDIVFSYTVGAGRFTSKQYDFMGGSSSGYSGKEAIVERYPARMHTACYVNPADPADAVLDRDYPEDLLFGLIPLAMTVVGATGLIAAGRRAKQPDGGKLWAPGVIPASGVTMWGGTVKRRAGDIGLVSALETEQTESPVELKPAATPAGSAATGVVISIIFNGIVILVLLHQLPIWKTRGVDWGLAAFLAIFGLMGVVILLGTIKALMRLLDPRVHVRLTPGTLRLGKDFAVEWELQGGSKRLSRLRIILECQEEAKVHGSKQDYTITSVCYREILLDTQQAGELASGRVAIKGPDGVMHSLNTGRNQITWRLRVEGKVAGWAGVKDEYPVVMLPEGWKEMA
jgi:hypothetical protein